MEHTVYFAMGFPGSGKTSFFKQYLITKYGEEDIQYLCRDKEVMSLAKTIGKNRARVQIHKMVSNIFTNFHTSEKQVLYYDSVNFSFEGRKFFYELLDPNVKLVIVNFEPARLITEGKFGKYVDWLYSVRTKHECFPVDRERAIETIDNINSNFDSLTEYEIEKYEIIKLPAFCDL